MILLPWLLLSAGSFPHTDADKVFQPALLVRTRKIMPDDPKRMDRQVVERVLGGREIILPGSRQYHVDRMRKLAPDDPKRVDQVVVEQVYSGDRALQGRTIRLLYTGLYRQWGEVAIDWLTPSSIDEPKCATYYSAPVGLSRICECTLWSYAGQFVPAKRVPFANPSEVVLFSQPSVRYSRIRQWAEVVEKVADQTGPKRIQLLKRYCLHPNPHVAPWCICLLAEYKPEGIIAFLKDLAANKELSVAGQIAVDEIMLALARKDWLNSPSRRALLDRWTSGEIIDAHDYQAVIDHLEFALDEDKIDWPTYLAFVVKWRTQQELPLAARFFLSPFSRAHPDHRPAAVHAVIRYLPVLLKAKDDPVKQTIAHEWLTEIKDYSKFNPEELRQLADLQRLTPDAKTSRLIATILDINKRPRR